MPIYEYRCSECSFQEEYLQKHSEAPLTVCPSCGKASFKKLLSAAGFQLKGSGWYATDFKGSGAKPAGKADGEAKSAGEAKSDADGAKAPGKSESKTGSGGSADKASGEKPASDSGAAATSKPAAAPASS